VEPFLRIPDSEWSRIREQVEGLEAEENKRFDGKPILGPGKRLAAASTSTATAKA
jgi:hypothetical protein